MLLIISPSKQNLCFSFPSKFYGTYNEEKIFSNAENISKCVNRLRAGKAYFSSEGCEFQVPPYIPLPSSTQSGKTTKWEDSTQISKHVTNYFLTLKRRMKISKDTQWDHRRKSLMENWISIYNVKKEEKKEIKVLTLNFKMQIWILNNHISLRVCNTFFLFILVCKCIYKRLPLYFYEETVKVTAFPF